MLFLPPSIYDVLTPPAIERIRQQDVLRQKGVNFGLGPTIPICMTWTNEIFQPRHGEVGVVAASVLVSGLGNLGSTLTTYALYIGWLANAIRPHKYQKSNLVMIGILCGSILSAATMVVLLKVLGNGKAKQISSASSATEGEAVYMDSAARREVQQRGLGRILCFS